MLGSDQASAQKRKKKDVPIFEVPNFKLDEKTNYVMYTAVVQQAGTGAELYVKAMDWFKSAYKSPTEVIREKEDGKVIMGRGRFRLQRQNPETGKIAPEGIVQYNLTLRFKDGRYQYMITKINWRQASYYGIEKWVAENEKSYHAQFAEYLVQTNDHINSLIKELKKGMAVTEAKEEDW